MQIGFRFFRDALFLCLIGLSLVLGKVDSSFAASPLTTLPAATVPGKNETTISVKAGADTFNMYIKKDGTLMLKSGYLLIPDVKLGEAKVTDSSITFFLDIDVPKMKNSTLEHISGEITIFVTESGFGAMEIDIISEYSDQPDKHSVEEFEGSGSVSADGKGFKFSDNGPDGQRVDVEVKRP